MALIHCDFFSHALELSTSMCVILPQPAEGEAVPEGGYKTLTLLHGLSDDHTGWVRRTSIERYVEDLRLAVVMPAVHRSFYTDMASGGSYGVFVSEELPAISRSFFPLSAERRDNAIAGLSMGGYGAFKIAISRPECYAAAASLSGALDIASRQETEEEHFRKELEGIFGPLDELPGSPHDLFSLACRLMDSGGPRPRLYQCCGTGDFLYEHNIRFRDHARNLGLDLTYREDPGEEHTWSYWDRRIRSVLEWLQEPGPPEKPR